MRAERMILRAKHLAARRSLEAMVHRLIAENKELMARLGEAQAKLKDLEDEAASKLIRPPTMAETSKILVTK